MSNNIGDQMSKGQLVKARAYGSVLQPLLIEPLQFH